MARQGKAAFFRLSGKTSSVSPQTAALLIALTRSALQPGESVKLMIEKLHTKGSRAAPQSHASERRVRRRG
jgi:hypothetical protein